VVLSSPQDTCPPEAGELSNLQHVSSIGPESCPFYLEVAPWYGEQEFVGSVATSPINSCVGSPGQVFMVFCEACMSRLRFAEGVEDFLWKVIGRVAYPPEPGEPWPPAGERQTV
jgi:hypothetical protein